MVTRSGFRTPRHQHKSPVRLRGMYNVWTIQTATGENQEFSQSSIPRTPTSTRRSTLPTAFRTGFRVGYGECTGGVQTLRSEPYVYYKCPTSQLQANKCLASCCTIDWYSWSIYNNAFVKPDFSLAGVAIAVLGLGMQSRALCYVVHDSR